MNVKLLVKLAILNMRADRVCADLLKIAPIFSIPATLALPPPLSNPS